MQQSAGKGSTNAAVPSPESVSQYAYITYSDVSASSGFVYTPSGGFDPLYDYEIGWEQITSSTSTDIAVLYGTGGGPTFQITNYVFSMQGGYAESGGSNAYSGNGNYSSVSTRMTVGPTLTNGGAGAAGRIRVSRPGVSKEHWCSATTFGEYIGGNTVDYAYSGWGKRSATEVLTSIKVYPTAGTFTGRFWVAKYKVAA